VKVLKLNPAPSHKSQDTTLRTLLKGYQFCNMSGFEVLSTFWSSTTTNSWKAWVNMQWNPALRATNRSGEHIFLMVNRILSSHSDVRAPMISGIVKIRALGKASSSNCTTIMHHQRHGQKQERCLLLVQLSVSSPPHGLIIGRVALANVNKPDKVGSSFLVSLLANKMG